MNDIIVAVLVYCSGGASQGMASGLSFGGKGRGKQEDAHLYSKERGIKHKESEPQCVF